MKKELVVFISLPNYQWYLDEVIKFLQTPYLFISPLEIKERIKEIENASVVLTVHSFLPEVCELFEFVKGKVRTITLQDGIIEYKSSSHRFRGLYRYRPVCSDEIFVFGDRSKRLIRASGNKNTVVTITGCPRFDYLRSTDSESGHGNKEILITMSNRPGYGANNTRRFYKLLSSITDKFDQDDIQYELRLSRGVAQGGQEHYSKIPSLTISNGLQSKIDAPVSKVELSKQLKKTSILFTTPSTVSLEAMVAGIPVAHLDFDTTPTYLQTVWRAKYGDNYVELSERMLNPSRMEVEFQQLIVEENISYLGESGERIAHRLDEYIYG